MPANVVRSPHEAKMWRQAKEAAQREGRAKDWAYIIATFERMKAQVGGKKGSDAYRKDMHHNKHGRLVLKRGVDTLQGAEDNPQVADPADNSRITEQGVVDPKTPVEMPTMPGTIRVYKNGKRTKYAMHPEAEPKPMVYSQRAVIRKSKLSDPLQQKLAEGEAHWVTVKDGPLEGRHLLIDGPRPEKGTQSHGKILAGHGIPAHVIEKITGATHAHHLDHVVSDGPTEGEDAAAPGISRYLTAQHRPHRLVPANADAPGTERGFAPSHQIEIGDGHQERTVPNRYSRGTHRETVPGTIQIGKRREGGFWLDTAYADKEAIKAHGARWDDHQKMWYAPDQGVVEAVLADATHFPHVTIHPSATYSYDHASPTASVPAASPPAGLPPLQGTPKQVAWAVRIRDQLFAPIPRAGGAPFPSPAEFVEKRIHAPLRTDLTPDQRHTAEAMRAAMQTEWTRIQNQTDARWWIDRRQDLDPASGEVYLWGRIRRAAKMAVEAQDSVHKSARDTRGVFIRKCGAAHRGVTFTPKHRLKSNRPDPSAMPGQIGPGQAHMMQESSMQVMHAITQSQRRNPHPDWGFDPAANLPGNTAHPKPVGKPNIFVYKSNPDITQAIHDYTALLEAGKSPMVALQKIGQRWPWVLGIDSPRSRDWWAAVRRADLPRPPQFEGVDTEVDADNTEAPRRKKHAIFWREGPANLGQGIMAPTGSGGAGR